MLMLIISSIILIIIPAFLSLLTNKKIQLSPKHLSLGMLFSFLTLIKLPFLALTGGQSILLATLISTGIYVLTESIFRIYLYRQHSHQTLNNILSIGLGYVLLKLVAIFLFQLYNFTQFTVTLRQHPELVSELVKTIDTNVLYLGQIFHSAYVLLYCVMILFFIMIQNQKVKHFFKYELLFILINFMVVLIVTTMNYLASTPSFFQIYFYFNIFLILLLITSLFSIYKYVSTFDSSNS